MLGVRTSARTEPGRAVTPRRERRSRLGCDPGHGGMAGRIRTDTVEAHDLGCSPLHHGHRDSRPDTGTAGLEPAPSRLTTRALSSSELRPHKARTEASKGRHAEPGRKVAARPRRSGHQGSDGGQQGPSRRAGKEGRGSPAAFRSPRLGRRPARAVTPSREGRSRLARGLPVTIARVGFEPTSRAHEAREDSRSSTAHRIPAGIAKVCPAGVEPAVSGSRSRRDVRLPHRQKYPRRESNPLPPGREPGVISTSTTGARSEAPESNQALLDISQPCRHGHRPPSGSGGRGRTCVSRSTVARLPIRPRRNEGGRRGSRTPKARGPTRFRDGVPRRWQSFRRWLRQESNLQPADQESAALPVELRSREAWPAGLEPATPRVSGGRSTPLSYGHTNGRCGWARTSGLSFVRRAFSASERVTGRPQPSRDLPRLGVTNPRPLRPGQRAGVELRDKDSNLDLHVQGVGSCRLDDPGPMRPSALRPALARQELDAAADTRRHVSLVRLMPRTMFSMPLAYPSTLDRRAAAARARRKTSYVEELWSPTPLRGSRNAQAKAERIS
jgi:hypothetical protein